MRNPRDNLAMLYQVQERDEQAASLYQQALHTREQLLGLDHPDTVSTFNRLATPYREQGKHRQAELLSQRAYA